MMIHLCGHEDVQTTVMQRLSEAYRGDAVVRRQEVRAGAVTGAE